MSGLDDSVNFHTFQFQIYPSPVPRPEKTKLINWKKKKKPPNQNKICSTSTVLKWTGSPTSYVNLPTKLYVCEVSYLI